MRRANPFKTTAFRLALGYGVLFVLSVAVLFAIVYVVLDDFSSSQIRLGVESESAALADEAQSDGLDRVVSLVEGRISADRDEAHYLVLAADGRRLAGNLPVSAGMEGWTTFADPATDDDEVEKLIALGTSLDDGALIVVAHETHEKDELLSALIAAFAIAGGLSLALALAAGLLLSRAFLARIEHFNETASRIMQGQLEERVPLRGSGDELDRLAGNVNAMLARIQALMEGMRQVSSDVAHDLRTPLARLRQGLEQANRKAVSIEAYREAVDRAMAETDEILATFAALLRIAQIEAGSRRAGFTQVDLSGVFAAIEEAYGAVVEDSGRRLSTSVDQGLSYHGDRELLMQMLANLLDNAITHTPAKTLISLSLHREARAIVGTVADNGIGISQSERGKVMQRFYRLEHSRTTHGNGLGLALVSAIAALHGIDVVLDDNQPGLAVRLIFNEGRA